MGKSCTESESLFELSNALSFQMGHRSYAAAASAAVTKVCT